MGMMSSCMTGMGSFWLLSILGVVGAGGLAAMLLLRGAGSPLPVALSVPAGEDRALGTLRDRFARGEIDRTEYEERRQALMANESPWT